MGLCLCLGRASGLGRVRRLSPVNQARAAPAPRCPQGGLGVAEGGSARAAKASASSPLRALA